MRARGFDEGSHSQATGTRPQRLRASTDVRAVFGARRTTSSAVAVIHARPQTTPGAPRVTVVAGRAMGNAVQRNRIKRRLRAALTACDLPAGVDYVVVGRGRAASATLPELEAQLQQSLLRVVEMSR